MITIQPVYATAHRLALKTALADYEKRAKLRETRQQALKGLTDEEEALQGLTRMALEDLEAQMRSGPPIPVERMPRHDVMYATGADGGESHRFGGPGVESKVRGPQLKTDEEPLDDEDEP